MGCLLLVLLAVAWLAGAVMPWWLWALVIFVALVLPND